MTYEEALSYIHSVIWRGKRLGLTRIQELLMRMGNPEKKLKFVHIAGTNGKGSTAAMTASVLQEAGYRTGLFISPFIHCFNERMQINGSPISDEELVEVTASIRPLAEAMEDKPTEFELITALAFAYFYRNHCDIVVLEVGLGGAMDSTNVIDTPEAAVITALGLDHTKELGGAIEEIARAKAGIIKKNSRVVFYGRNEAALPVIRKAVENSGSTLVMPDYDRLHVRSRDLTGQTFSYEDYENLRIALLGVYQLYNAAVVIETVRELRKGGWQIHDEALRTGLLHTRWTGRLERIGSHPDIFVDGSHNPQGVKATAESLKTYFPGGGITFLVGVLADKDAVNMIKELPSLASSFVTVTPPSMRGMTAEELAGLMQSITDRPVAAAESLEEGCRMALEAAGEDGVVCAIGSLYTVGDLTRIFRQQTV
ncbi:MAG: bifunctional folylpolyglutamate synthase/dihydrofolate synthase [Lachnospiraceae bacterium]|jgi:dihydrofolate synthase/folylpolyglutamate synthase|nr:bifunctional folylpolyglutamate synthase/dihydrofolate synthase [Lachnospiraceae bacterium]